MDMNFLCVYKKAFLMVYIHSGLSETHLPASPIYLLTLPLIINMSSCLLFAFILFSSVASPGNLFSIFTAA